MNSKFNFMGVSGLSFTDIQERIKTDPFFPESRRAHALTSVKRSLKWCLRTERGRHALGMMDPARLPYNGSMLKAMFANFAPELLGVGLKSIQNVRSDLKFIAHFYGITKRQPFAPFTQDMGAALRRVSSQFDRYELSRFLHYLAAHQFPFADVNQTHFESFCAALRGDWTIRNPEAIAARTRRTWNRLARKYSFWPQMYMSGGKRRQPFGMPFTAFPDVQREALAFLRRGLDHSGDWAGPDAEAPALRPATIFLQMEQYRMAASCLAASGVPIAEITGLRALCTPENFRRLINAYIARLGKTNRSVELMADVLLKTAKYAGALEKSEIEAVAKLHAKLSRRIAEFEKQKESKGEQLIAQFDDSALMNALIALPHYTVAEVIRSGKRGRMAAYAMQRALILELWLCAPIRLSNLLGLRLDRFFKVTIDGADTVVLRIPAKEVKNNRALEYLLHEDAAKLLRDYVDHWRPIIATTDSPYLFPGAKGGMKCKQVLATQMRKYIAKGCGVQFHPHLIRRIVAKLILDDEGGDLETARRQLGHADNRMLLNVYAQRKNLAIQKRYLVSLQARRLSAIEKFHTSPPSSRRAQGSAPPDRQRKPKSGRRRHPSRRPAKRKRHSHGA